MCGTGVKAGGESCLAPCWAPSEQSAGGRHFAYVEPSPNTANSEAALASGISQLRPMSPWVPALPNPQITCGAHCQAASSILLLSWPWFHQQTAALRSCGMHLASAFCKRHLVVGHLNQPKLQFLLTVKSLSLLLKHFYCKKMLCA